MADPNDYQMADPGVYQTADPRGYQMAEPRSYQMAEPRSYQMAEPRSYQMAERRSHQMAETRSYQMAEPRNYQMVDPRSYQMVDPRSYQIAEPRSYQIAEPRNYQMGEASSYQMGAPSSSKMGEHSRSQMSESSSSQMGEPSSSQMGEHSRSQMSEPRSYQLGERKGCPVLHSRIASHEYVRACFMAEQLSHGPPALHYEDHVYYKPQVQEGRLWMKMFGSCQKDLNRKDIDVYGIQKTGVVRRLIGRGTNEPLHFTIDEGRKSSKLHSMLSKSLGVLRRVERDRKYYMAEKANIIIDTIKDIGHFVEITVVRHPKQTVDASKCIGTFILNALGIKVPHRIPPFCEYIDLEPWPIYEGYESFPSVLSPAPKPN